MNTVTATLAQRSGLMMPGADTQAVIRMLRRFVQHDWRWYFTLALAVSSVPARDLRGLTCPVTVLAGQYDLLASPERATSPSRCSRKPACGSSRPAISCRLRRRMWWSTSCGRCFAGCRGRAGT
ncbi:hypothetical protein [Kibdelosporangium philippinense]|uniref:hypothetical protein n=1 Tax=Kibdelosporangium philippinense TaxID=211113 RepID=UPI003607B845